MKTYKGKYFEFEYPKGAKVKTRSRQTQCFIQYPDSTQIELEVCGDDLAEDILLCWKMPPTRDEVKIEYNESFSMGSFRGEAEITSFFDNTNKQVGLSIHAHFKVGASHFFA